MTIPHSNADLEIAVVVGTRPEIIKMAPVIRSLSKSERLSLYIAHTGQHYDYKLSKSFFDVLQLPDPHVHFGIGSGTHAEQTAEAMTAVESMLIERESQAVLSQGDTNTMLATAITAAKLPVPFGHVEAGIRSYDRMMPEEVNRVLADHVADFAFAPTVTAASNLSEEGISKNVYVTGNTVVDACKKHYQIAKQKSAVLDEHDLTPDNFVLATIHRERNTEDADRLTKILQALDRSSSSVLLPAHPRTVDAMKVTGFSPTGALTVVKPLDYLDFLKALGNAHLVVTDSGGVQEEAAILEIPCLTVRPNTERPETIDAGVNKLVEPEELEATLNRLLSNKAERDRMTGHPDLYGDGTAGEQIVEILESQIQDQH